MIMSHDAPNSFQAMFQLNIESIVLCIRAFPVLAILHSAGRACETAAQSEAQQAGRNWAHLYDASKLHSSIDCLSPNSYE